MTDLEFIKKNVKCWYKGVTTVRLDKDGEICFEGTCDTSYDFFPTGYHVSMFNPDFKSFGDKAITGIRYTRSELGL